jgi:hypothetical protein
MVASETGPVRRKVRRASGGFPVEKWPVCTLCEVSLPLVAQLRHDSKRLDLGKEGRVVRWLEKTEKLSPDEAWKCWDPEAWDLEWFELQERIESGLKHRPPYDYSLPEEWKMGSWRFAAQFEPRIWLPDVRISPHMNVVRFREFGDVETLEISLEGREPFQLHCYEEEDHYWMEIMNAGEEKGYLLIDPDPVHPKGIFFTQVF